MIGTAMRSGATPIYRLLPHNVLIYDGPSQLTGDRILVMATAQNGNRKIGRMLQLWIIPAMSPIDAVRSGGDAAVCGDCALRGDGFGNQRACYVEWWRSVSNIWQTHTRAERMDPGQFARLVDGIQLRIGAYGDPVAVPVSVWRPALHAAAGWTAYTHQWRRPGAQSAYADWCMASVESPAEQREARSRGWRTFRVRHPGDATSDDEVVCPHETTASIHCDSCALCRGSARPAKSIVVTVHGTGMKWFGTRRPS